MAPWFCFLNGTGIANGACANVSAFCNAACFSLGWSVFDSRKPRHFSWRCSPWFTTLLWHLPWLTFGHSFATALLYSAVYNWNEYKAQCPAKKWLVIMVGLYHNSSAAFIIALMIPLFEAGRANRLYPYETISGSIPTFKSYFSAGRKPFGTALAKPVLNIPRSGIMKYLPEVCNTGTAGFAGIRHTPVFCKTIFVVVLLPHLRMFVFAGFITFFLFLQFGDFFFVLGQYTSCRVMAPCAPCNRIVNIELLFLQELAWL